MKALILLLLGSFTLGLNAQKFAYVDTEYILSKMPEYEEAKKQLNALSVEWQKEVEKRYEIIEAKEREYEAQKLILPDDIAEAKALEIAKLKNEVEQYQNDKFGVDGELFQKRKELIEPIQNKIYTAIKELASTRNYDMIFDKSAPGTNILFASAKLDQSKYILKQLGLK